MHFLISKREFTEIMKILNGIKGIHKKNSRKLRKFINAVLYRIRTGCQWRMLPFYFGKWRAIHKRFMKWSVDGIWEKIFKAVQINPDMEWVMIDSTVVRAHACSSGYGKNSQEIEALGRSKGGFTTKIHTLVDALGNPLKFILSPGQRNDITQAEKLVQNIENSGVIGDKGYDSDSFAQSLAQKNCTPIIPPRSNRKTPRTYDNHLYIERHLIECFFGKIKHFRGVFSRYDKSAHAFLSSLYLVGALIWLK